MFRKIIVSSCWIAGLFVQLAWAQVPIASIEEAFVSRVLKEFSADSMGGRKIHTPYVDKAANYLAREFEAMDIDTYPGYDSFFQSFQVYNLHPDSSSVSLNGKSVDPDNILYQTAYREIDWKSTETQHKVIRVGQDDDLQQGMIQALNSKEDQLVLLHPSHKNSFKRFRNFFSKRREYTKLDEGITSVFILGEFEEEVEVELYARHEVDSSAFKNVMAYIPGKRSEEYVVFSGHYDHIGIGRPVDGDSIYNGANDDASGTTAVLALAKHFHQLPQPERSLIFVAFTAEEGGMYGSKYFSNQLNPEQVIAMFNIEMIGSVSEEGPSSAWITGFDRSSFGEIIQQNLKDSPYNFYADPYPKQNLFYRSDNATLARLGVPAHTISTTPIGKPEGMKHYHRPSDEFETLDTAHITDIIRGIARSATSIVNGEATPTRVDKEGM